ncbi:ABC transporter permease [Levilactobacillus huananensis]|uniref:ABC transporter permease n=1 Tax=Levilactobacillus huananensis TaxID=2486019 RepID=UPI000F77E22F|nr:ABC transporter permease [Levilactobacillus huananensis]
MTSFGRIFKVLTRSKFREANLLLLIQLIAIAVSLVWILITGALSTTSLLQAVSSWAGVTYVVGFYLIARRSEQAYTQDTFRLIPVEETWLYLGNLLSSFVMFFYIMGVEVLLHLAGIGIGWQALRKDLGIHPVDMGPNTPWDIIKIVMLVALLVLIVIVLMWTTITFVHLVVSATSNFLPSASKRLVNFVLYIVVIFLVVRVAAFLIVLFSRVTSSLPTSGGIMDLWWPIGGMVLVIVIESVASVFLLKKWVETVPN